MHHLLKICVLWSFLVPAGFILGCSDGAEPSGDGDSSTGGSGNSGTADGGSSSNDGGSGGVASGAGGENSASGGGDNPGSGGSAQVGVQADPGTDGDGTYDHPEPYPAPPEALSRLNGAPEGQVTGSMFYDSKLIYPTLTFEYWIYVPAQYEPGKPAALMVFQDGSHYVGASAAFNTPIVFDNLIHEGTMPPTIALFINPGSESESGVYQYPAEIPLRSNQYDTPSPVFSQFLLEEAIPDLIQSQYDIVDDPNGWAIGGHSSGGICSLIAAWYNPDTFRKVLTHNASFPNTSGVFPQIIADTSPNLPLRIYLLSSPNDIGGSTAGQWFDTNNQAAAILAEKGYHYRYRPGVGGHFPPTQSESDYPNALRWLWRGYSLPWYSSF